MYILTETGLAESATLADAPKVSAADAQVLAKAATLAAACGKAVAELEKSVGFLATAAQQDLLRDILGVLRVFLPDRHGVWDRNGRVLKTSARYRTEVIPKNPPRDVPFFFHHDTWFYVSFQKATAAGIQRPFEPGHRCWIYLCAANLTTSIEPLADVLVHEAMHMQAHRYRSIEQKFGSRVAGETPTGAAGGLLNRSSFNPLRAVMEKHFETVAAFLNRQPHRRGSLAALSASVVKQWAELLVEEVLAYVFAERATWALAQLAASKTGAGISQQFAPMTFLKRYFRTYWLSDPVDLAALRSNASDAVFKPMERDLLNLVAAVRQHFGP